MIEFIGSMIDLASGTAREPVTKSVCKSTTIRAGMNLFKVSRFLEKVFGVTPGIISGMMERVSE